MPYKVTKHIMRSSSLVPFYHDAFPRNQNHLDWMDTNFVNTGKLISKQTTFADNNLTCIIETIWDSQISFEQFVLDPYCIQEYIEPARMYEEANGFVTNVTYMQI